MPTPTYFPVAGGGTFSNDWGAARRTTGRHKGTDIFAPHGTPVVAVASGIITKIGRQKIGGLRVWIDGKYYYAHLSRYEKGLKKGDRVVAGQVIGYVGTTGDAKGTKPHLHFGYDPTGQHGKNWRNPYTILKQLESGQAPQPFEPTPQAPQPPQEDTSVVPAELPRFGELGTTEIVPPGGGGMPLPGTVSPGPVVPRTVTDLWRIVAAQTAAGETTRRWSELASAGE